VAVGAGCGLRLGECLGLRLSRVRFLDRELDVAEQLVLLPGAPPKLTPPKTTSSIRTVPLPTTVALALSAHLAAHPADPDELVFRSKVGGPIWPNSFRESVWVPAVRRAGLPAGTRYHDLRHFTASALIATGQSVKVVQAVLGHASAAMTLDVYAGLWPDSEDRARDAIDAAFAAPADQVRTAGSLPAG
jgi:integrase